LTSPFDPTWLPFTVMTLPPAVAGADVPAVPVRPFVPVLTEINGDDDGDVETPVLVLALPFAAPLALTPLFEDEPRRAPELADAPLLVFVAVVA
jgi:hypothetical protein